MHKMHYFIKFEKKRKWTMCKRKALHFRQRLWWTPEFMHLLELRMCSTLKRKTQLAKCNLKA